MGVAGLAAAIDELCAVDPGSLADGDTLQVLQKQLSRLDAVVTRAAAMFDANREWEADGARTAAAWLAAKTRVPLRDARRRIRLGRMLRHLPSAESAWLAGTVDGAHVGLLTSVRNERSSDAMERDEAFLVDQAGAFSFAKFARLVAYWSQLADPDGVEAAADAQRATRVLHLSQSIDNRWFGDVVLDPLNGSIVHDTIESIERELFAADWADAKARVGDTVSVADLSRTPAQRRADALVEIAIRARTAPADGRRPEPLFSVLIGYETFAGRICELANRTVLTPGMLVPWLDQARIERIVYDGPSRVVDVGVTRRFFTGATRRAVEVRDLECYHELCEEPVEHCDIDHIEPAAVGGITVQTNGRAACRYHNQLRNRSP